MTTQAARWGGAFVVVVALGAGWLAFTVASGPGPTPPAPSASTAPSSGARPDTVEPTELVIFQEIVSARRASRLDAQKLVPLSDGARLPFAPDPSGRGDEKRRRLASDGALKWMAAIAADHGLTVEEVEAIARRGDAEGWRDRGL